MNAEKNKITERKFILYKIFRTAAVVSAIFGLTVSILVLAHHFQTRAVKPLNSPALQELMMVLEENPEDQVLREQIRALDLRARKAFFLSQWQIKTGGFLLFGSAVLFFICMRMMGWLRGKIPVVKEEIPDPWKSAVLSRKWLSLIGGSIAVIGLIFTFISYSELNQLVLSTSGEEPTGLLAVKEDNGDGNGLFPDLEDLREHWPSFRGPGGNGIGFFTNIPTDWDGPSGRNILWQTEIPEPGFNSPIRWGDKLFLSGGSKEIRQPSSLV